MNLSKEMKGLLIKELEFISKKMKSTDNLAEKLYFFSAIYAVAHRVFNIEFHPELVFIHNVIQSAYQQINTALSAASQAGQTIIGIPDGLFDAIETSVQEMTYGIAEDKDISHILQRISNLSYSTSGNGHYLFVKGMLLI